MLRAIQQFFESQIAPDAVESSPADREHSYQLATAALLLEMSRADFDAKPEEREAVRRAVEQTFGLGKEETETLVELAEQEVADATSLYQFTRLINDHFDAEEKAHVVELLWRVAYADGSLDKYEDHLARRVADLLHVPHKTFIRAKHRAAKARA